MEKNQRMVDGKGSSVVVDGKESGEDGKARR
jgi:hypothetical protein